MKRRSFTLMAAASALSAGLLPRLALAADDTVTVGSIEILTGPAAPYGIAISSGEKLALEEINAAGGVLGGRKLALIVEDSSGNKDQAINAARTLIGRSKVSAIIGPTLSAEYFAVAPQTNGRKVPLIGTSITAIGATDIGPYCFRTSLPEADVIPAALKKAMARGAKTIALLYANDDLFSKSSYDQMKAAADAVGLKIVDIETFSQKDTDFSAQLTKVKGLKPDAVGIAALVEPTAGVLLQARQLGFGDETIFIGGNGANSPRLGEIAGKAADGIIVGSPWFIAKDTPQNKAFVAAFNQHYGKDPDQFAAQAYDTMKLLALAIDKAGSGDPLKIRDALLEVKQDGVMGPLSFNAKRDPASAEGVLVLEMHGGKFSIAP